MNCLCCGKPLRTDDASGWHTSCIKRFFGTAKLPQIEIDDRTLENLAAQTIHRGYTVPGVQKKLSLHLSQEQTPRLTIVNYPTGYILKPQVAEYTALPEAEQLVMSMADAAGIATVPHALIREREAYAYITKRIDRAFAKNSPVKMLAMEDFCQLDLRLTQDKYRGSYERCAKIIERYSVRKGLDLSELFSRLVFSYIVGNSDMHLKNFSLIETAEGTGEYVLSPAYDLLPVNVIMPEDREQFALAMNGKKMNLGRKDFLLFAEECGMQRNAAEKMIHALVAMLPTFQAMCEKALLPDVMRNGLAELVKHRCEKLEQ